jgi:hypothetical protein
VLVAVGTGEEVVGAGAGLVAGGARVWLTVTLGLGDAAGALADCGDGRAVAVACAACAVCRALGRAAVPVAGRVLGVPCGFAPCCPGACDGAAVAAGSVGGTVCTLAAGADAVRANTIAKPTVASAPNWAVRQVSLLSRRKPSSRASAGESS